MQTVENGVVRGLPPPVMDHFLGLDLGQAQDPTALVVIERRFWPGLSSRPQYWCRHLQRWQLGTPYPEIVRDMTKLSSAIGPNGLPVLPGATLVIDGTGVGRAVVDMFRCVPELARRIMPVIITAGHATAYEGGAWHVPKKELVGVLQVLIQTGRLKVAKSLPDAPILTKELLNFKVKITTAGNETFEAWRERDHDDLVLGLAVALWYAEKNPPRSPQYDWPCVLVPGRQDPFWPAGRRW
jgi:hypothetical protein